MYLRIQYPDPKHERSKVFNGEKLYNEAIDLSLDDEDAEFLLKHSHLEGGCLLLNRGCTASLETSSLRADRMLEAFQEKELENDKTG